jgi:hypothetical protein
VLRIIFALVPWPQAFFLLLPPLTSPRLFNASIGILNDG